MSVAVKMSLHRPGDVVRMMDKGMAVQPGLRTLVELRYAEVLSQTSIVQLLTRGTVFCGFTLALSLYHCTDLYVSQCLFL